MASSTQLKKYQPKSPGTTMKSTLGVFAIAVGVGILGAFALDLHGHTCEACGQKWRHLGAFSLGDLGAHTCRKCGTVQWWKNGWQNAGSNSDGAFQPMPALPPPLPSTPPDVLALLMKGRR